MNVTIKTQDEFQNAHVTVEIRHDGVRGHERYTLVPADSSRIEELEGVIRELRADHLKTRKLADGLSKAREELAQELVREKADHQANREWAERAETCIANQGSKIERLEGVITTQAGALRAVHDQLDRVREITYSNDLIDFPQAGWPVMRQAILDIRQVLSASPPE